MLYGLISGLLIGTSYIPLPPWALFFALLPLWNYWLKETNPWKIFRAGWITQFVLTLIGFHWIAHTAVEFGHLPWSVGALAVIGYALFAALYIPISGLIWAHIQKRRPLSPTFSIFFFVISYVLLEDLWPTIFPWNMGYPWYWAGLKGFQTADLWGFHGLSFFTLLLNALLLLAWRNRMRTGKSLGWTTAAFVLFGGLQVLGGWRLSQLPTADRNLKVLAVQANIGNLEKHVAERGNQFRDAILDKYFDITRQGLAQHPDTELIVYPETAMPISLDTHFFHLVNQTKFRSFLGSTGKSILTGAYSADPTQRFVYNGMFLFSPDGTLLSQYRKTILLAFGEYFPGAEYFPFLKTLVPEISDFSRGSGPVVMSWKDPTGNPINIGPLICYEGLHPWFPSAQADNGALFYVNVTNDSWFGTTFEPHQHLYMTLARSIEMRRPMVRITNTGISTVVLADGRVLEKSPMMSEWFYQFSLEFLSQPPTTPFQRFGACINWVLGLALILLVLIGKRHEPLSAS